MSPAPTPPVGQPPAAGRGNAAGRGRNGRAQPSASVRRVEKAAGALSTRTVQAMDETLGWFRELPPEQRSWVGLVAQAGLTSFVQWFRQQDGAGQVTAEVFAAAPRELTRLITLEQTVSLVRVAVGVIEDQVEELAAPGEEALLREAVLTYSREIAFAAANVYARAAEARGAWDARLEALVVDALMRGEADEALASRAAALGWGSLGQVAVVVGASPSGSPEAVVDGLHRTAGSLRVDVLAGVHGERLMVVCGAPDLVVAVVGLLPAFGAGPVVIGPTVPDLFGAAGSASAALAGWRSVRGWPAAPRPVEADALLPERALAGDPLARRQLVDLVYLPLRDGGPVMLETVSTYLECGGSIEQTARELYLHPNTVRYRLRKAEQTSGAAVTEPREAFVVQVAIALGRMEE